MLEAWGRLRAARVLGLRRARGEAEGTTRIMVYATTTSLSDESRADLAFLRDTLGLDPELNEYSLRYGLIPEGGHEIVVLTNSILEMMNELAWYIDVPPQHLEEGRTGMKFVNQNTDQPPLIRVYYADEPPEDAYVAVKSRDYWFYVDDRDMYSKRTFAIMQVIFSLTDTGDTARGPVVSITN
jgi:hypothetical protein